MPPPAASSNAPSATALSQRFLHIHHSSLTAWIVLLGGLLVTTAAWYMSGSAAVALGGTVIALLLFYIIFSLVVLQERAEKLAEERTRELRAAKTELEAKIEESEQLVEVLTATNEELSQFAYVASHDMKEPLRMITNFTSLLKEDYGDKLDDNALLYIQIACDSATRMQLLVNDLLEYARLDRESERLIEIDLRREFSYVCEDLHAAIEQSGATVTCDRDMPMVTGNPVRLKSLLQNLVSNALKYHRAGVPPSIHFGVNEQGDSREFYVRDNGIGIEPRYQARIFQPFKRLHAVDQYNGTGVGLAICRKIVLGMGGELRVESKPGAGSTFYFSLPGNRVGSGRSVLPGDNGQGQPEVLDRGDDIDEVAQ